MHFPRFPLRRAGGWGWIRFMVHPRCFLVAIATVLALLVNAGCSNCRSACENAKDRGCASCDCDACSDAPDDCDDYFDCIVDAESCLEMAFCNAPPSCNTYVRANCS
jgi:hypothetical protein